MAPRSLRRNGWIAVRPPEAKPFHDVMKLTDLKFGDYGQTSVQEWEGLETVRRAIEKLTMPNPTRAAFLAVAAALGTLTGAARPAAAQAPPVKILSVKIGLPPGRFQRRQLWMI